MNRLACSAFVVALAVVRASAGEVSFHPSVATVQAGGKATFAIAVAALASLPSANRVSVMLGSPDGLPLSFQAASGFHREILDCPAVYPSQICIVGEGPPGFPVHPPVFMGSLTVDTAGLQPGSYFIVVDPVMEEGVIGRELSFVAFGANVEAIRGSGEIEIQPEPEPSGLRIRRFRFGGGSPMTSDDGTLQLRGGPVQVTGGSSAGGGLGVSGGFFFRFDPEIATATAE